MDCLYTHNQSIYSEVELSKVHFHISLLLKYIKPPVQNGKITTTGSTNEQQFECIKQYSHLYISTEVDIDLKMLDLVTLEGSAEHIL